MNVTPVMDARLNVSVEKPDAALVLVWIVAVYAVLARAYYLWKRKKAKEEVSSDTPPPTLESGE